MWRSSGSSAQVYGEVKQFSTWQLISAMSRSHLGPRECLCCGCTGGEVGFIHAFQGARAAKECCAKKLWWLQVGFSWEQLPECSCPVIWLGPAVLLGWASSRFPSLGDLCAPLHCTVRPWLQPCTPGPPFGGWWAHQEKEARWFSFQAETKPIICNEDSPQAMHLSFYCLEYFSR